MTSKNTTAAIAARGAAASATITSRLLSLPAVVAATGVSRASIYVWMKVGGFPKPVKLGPRRVAWKQADVETWISSRQMAA